MKRVLLFVSGMFLLINFACQKEIEQKKEKQQKNPKKYSFVVKRNLDFVDFKELKSDKTNKTQDFFKLVESFQPESFSLDELIDLTDKNLKMIKTLQIKRMKTSLDTAAIKSRLVLTEIYLRKLKYLIHQPVPQKDTIDHTLNAIVANLNSVINQMKIYNNSTDEFESILKHDSIASKQQRIKDSIDKLKMPHLLKGVHDLPQNH